MISNKKILALIPARGGSKRLPQKNILPLNSKPLIGWTIESAISSKYIDRIIVSTDDEKIKLVASQYGVEIPELRPSYLSDDHATSLDVILHILNRYREDEDILILLQPTSPLRNDTHINEAIELFLDKKADAVISVTNCEHSPLWCNTLPKNGVMDGFIKSEDIKRSQDLAEFYRLNGAIYIFDIDSLLLSKQFKYTKSTYAYKMMNYDSVDIDTVTDFEYAEFLMNKRSGRV